MVFRKRKSLFLACIHQAELGGFIARNKMIKRGRRKPMVRRVATNCGFCHAKTQPDWKKPEDLSQYLSERGRIIGKGLTGLCAKHQRRVTREIKRARFLALLPYVAKIK